MTAVVGLMFFAGCLLLASARPGTRAETWGAILLLSSALMIPLTLAPG